MNRVRLAVVQRKNARLPRWLRVKRDRAPWVRLPRGANMIIAQAEQLLLVEHVTKVFIFLDFSCIFQGKHFQSLVKQNLEVL